MEYTKGGLRNWLIKHEYMIDFRAGDCVSRTIRATKAEWDDFYKLLSQAEAAPDMYGALESIIKNSGTNIMGQPLCPLHGPDCNPKNCRVHKAIVKAEGKS